MMRLLFKPAFCRHIKCLMTFVGFLILSLVVAGCASIQDSVDPQLPEDLPAAWTADIAIEELPITASLLDLIDQKSLRELVQEALRNNPDIRVTALRLKAAGYLLSEPRSQLLPRLNAEFSKGRDNQTVDAATGERRTANSHRMSLGLSWEIDIWGRLADEYAASKYTVLAQEYEYRRALDALAARVIQTWIDQVALRRSLSIEAERVAVLHRIETVLIERYKDGIGSLEEYATAKSRTEIARADLSVQRTAWRQAIRKLEVLLGRYPRGELLSGSNLPAVAPPPVGVPAAVLLNRPDVKAALARVESSKRQSSAAKKALLPDLRLSGQLFRQSARLDNIDGSTTYWNILGALFQPLFEGGRLINQARARRTEVEASLLELYEVVLQALEEVENAFDLEHELATQARALRIAARESEKSSRYFVERYRQGLDSIQSLLIAKEQEMSVRFRLNKVVSERLSSRIDLALALGVGLDTESTPTLQSVKPQI